MLPLLFDYCPTWREHLSAGAGQIRLIASQAGNYLWSLKEKYQLQVASNGYIFCKAWVLEQLSVGISSKIQEHLMSERSDEERLACGLVMMAASYAALFYIWHKTEAQALVRNAERRANRPE